MHGHVGQPARHRRPGLACVERDEHAHVRAHVEEVLGLGVLADGVDGLGGQARGQRLPGLAVVLRPEHVRRELVVPVPALRDVDGALVEARGHHARDPAPGGQAARQVAPAQAAVARAPDLPLVRPRVQHAEALGRLRDGGDGPEGDVPLLRARGEVVGERGPGVSAVEGAVEPVRAVIEDVARVRGDDERGDPVVAERLLLLLRAQLRARADPLAVSRLEVQARGEAELVSRVDDGGVLGIDGHRGPVAAVDRFPGRGVALARPVGRGPAHDPVVLQPTHDVVGLGVVEGQRGELAHGQVVDLGPRAAVVEGEVEAAVVAQGQPLRRARVHEQHVVVDVHAALVEPRPGLAAVRRAQEGHPAEVDALGVGGVHADAAEVVAVGVVDLVEAVLVRAVPGGPAVVAAVDLRPHDLPLEQVAVGVDEVGHEVGHRDLARLDVALEGRRVEGLGEVVAAQEAGDHGIVEAGEGLRAQHAQAAGRELPGGRLLVHLLGLRAQGLVVDHGIQGLGPRGGQGQADAAHGGAGGEPAAEPRPVRAGVDRLPDAAARPALEEVAGRARALPHGGVQDVGPARVLDEVDGPRVVVHVEDPRPALPAVRRLVDAALGVVRVEVAGGRHVHRPRVARVDHDAPDVVRVGEPHVAPRAPAVRRLEDARARVRGPARVVLARAHVEGPPVRVPQGHVADGDGRLAVEQGRPAPAAVVRAPDAARGEGDHERVGMGRRRLDVHDAAALHLRPHGAEAESSQDRLLLHLLAQLVSGPPRGGGHALAARMERLLLLLLAQGRLLGRGLVAQGGAGQAQ